MLGFELSTADCAPFETVAGIEPDGGGTPCPEEFRGRVSIDVIHDGKFVPQRFYDAAITHGTHAEMIRRQYVVERDWGAEQVARHLTAALHLGSYHRVNVARTLLDFGRFPGCTIPGSSFVDRF